MGHSNGTRWESACSFFPPARVLPTASEPNVAAFLGIPYATPPTGEKRFRPPEPIKAWSKPLNAHKPGNICAQLPANALVKIPPQLLTKPNEDCLYLNVWVPTKTDGSIEHDNKPVLVFLHGGGYIGGNGFTELNCDFYDGQGLAKDIGAIVITINYRVGIFGFLAHPELFEESGTTGNYGIQDQREALKWIRNTASSFGGDPNRVTVMGQSAGATSVLHHLLLPRSEGLFSKAISMSGYGVTWSLEKAYNRSRSLLSHLGSYTTALPL